MYLSLKVYVVAAEILISREQLNILNTLKMLVWFGLLGFMAYQPL